MTDAKPLTAEEITHKLRAHATCFLRGELHHDLMMEAATAIEALDAEIKRLQSDSRVNSEIVRKCRERLATCQVIGRSQFRIFYALASTEPHQ